VTPREQQFVQYILRGKDAAYAAHCSGVRYDCVPTDMRAPHVIAEELMQRADIIMAIGDRPEGSQVTKELLVADAYEIKERALADERYSEAINALKLVGDFEGLRAQKLDITVKKEATQMSEAELLQIINGGSSGKLLDVTPSKVEVGDGGA